MPETNETPDTNQATPETVERTYTESEVNDKIQKAVQDRLNRERKKYEGFDELKAEIEDLRTFKNTAEEQNLSEIEKLQKQLEATTKEKEDLFSNFNSLQEQLKKDKLHNSFKELARTKNIQYIDDALQLVASQLSSLEANEDGSYSGLEDIVENLVSSKPYLLAKESPKPIGNASNPNQEIVEKSSEQLLKEAAEKYRKSQREEDLVAYMQLKRSIGK